MTVTPVMLFSPAQLTNAAATYYTSPALTKTRITKLTFTNTTSGAVTITLYIIKNGGTASDANTLSKVISIAVDTTYEAFEAEGMVLEAGDFIQALCSANTSVTIMGAGLQIV